MRSVLQNLIEKGVALGALTFLSGKQAKEQKPFETPLIPSSTNKLLYVESQGKASEKVKNLIALKTAFGKALKGQA